MKNVIKIGSISRKIKGLKISKMNPEPIKDEMTVKRKSYQMKYKASSVKNSDDSNEIFELDTDSKDSSTDQTHRTVELVTPGELLRTRRKRNLSFSQQITQTFDSETQLTAFSEDVEFPKEKIPLPFISKIEQFHLNPIMRYAIWLNNQDTTIYWSNKFDFLIIAMSYCMGFGNFFQFPIKIIAKTGFLFFLFHFIFLFIVAYPIMISEITIGQFSGYGSYKCFDFCPLLSGQSVVMNIFVFLRELNLIIVMGWSMIYVFNGFYHPLTWEKCNNNYNNDRCVPNNIVDEQKSINESAVFQFWTNVVIGENSSELRVSSNLGIALLVVFVPCVIVCCFGIKGFSSIIYFTAAYPLVALLQLFMLACVLPGAFQGLIYFVFPDFDFFANPVNIISLLQYSAFPGGLGTGVYLTLGRFNKFNDKIAIYVKVILAVEFFVTVLIGFITFSLIGHFSYSSNLSISTIIENEDSFFLLFPKGYSDIEITNYWCLTLFMSIIILGFNVICCLTHVYYSLLCDLWPSLSNISDQIKISFVLFVPTYFVSLIFATPYGENWMNYLTENIIIPGQLLQIALQTITVSWCYTVTQLNYDLQLMTGFQLHKFYEIILIIIPVIFISLTIALFLFTKSTIYKYNLIKVLTIVFIFSPVLIKSIYVFAKYFYYKQLNQLSLLSYLSYLLHPPPKWGPRSNLQWFKSSFYSSKMCEFQTHTDFQQKFVEMKRIYKKLIGERDKFSSFRN